MKAEFFTIKVWMKNGEVLETRRYTQEGMTECVEQYYPFGLGGYAEGVEKVLVFEGDAE